MLTNFRACRQTWPVSVELDQTHYFHVFRNKNCKSSNGIAWLHYQDSSNSFHKQEQENYIWLPIHFSVQRVQQPKRHTCYLVQIRAFSDYCQVYRKGWSTENFPKTDQILEKATLSLHYNYLCDYGRNVYCCWYDRFHGEFSQLYGKLTAFRFSLRISWWKKPKWAS